MVTACLPLSVHLVNDCQKALLYMGYTNIHKWPAREVLAETAETANVCVRVMCVQVMSCKSQAINRKEKRILFILTLHFHWKLTEFWTRAQFRNICSYPYLTHQVPSGTGWISTVQRAYLYLQIPVSFSTRSTEASVAPNTTCSQLVFQVRHRVAWQELIAVSLRQLYSTLRLYTNSLHPIRQQGNQWPPLVGSKRVTFLPLFPRERPDLRGGHGEGDDVQHFFL